MSMRRLASTQSKYDGPNQSSFCSVENSILSYHKFLQNGRKVDIIHGRQIMPKPWMHKEEQRKTAANSLLDRWQNDEIYRASQLVHGWTEESVKYFDYISKIDISFAAPYNQRSRYENSLLMRGVDSKKQAGPLCQRPDYKSSANLLVGIQREQGKGVPQITCICAKETK